MGHSAPHAGVATGGQAACMPELPRRASERRQGGAFPMFWRLGFDPALHLRCLQLEGAKQATAAAEREAASLGEDLVQARAALAELRSQQGEAPDMSEVCCCRYCSLRFPCLFPVLPWWQPPQPSPVLPAAAAAACAQTARSGRTFITQSPPVCLVPQLESAKHAAAAAQDEAAALRKELGQARAAVKELHEQLADSHCSPLLNSPQQVRPPAVDSGLRLAARCDSHFGRVPFASAISTS